MAGSTATVQIDGVDITGDALQGSVSRRLNRPSVANVVVPFDMVPTFSVGSLLKVYVDSTLFFHGRILQSEIDADENTGRVTFNATDPLELWQWRPVRGNSLADGTAGSLIDPTIISDYGTGPQIVQAMIAASQDESLIPQKAEGPLFLIEGGYAVGGKDLTGVPVDWPMTMADMAALLISTGTVDIVVTPIELTPSGHYEPDCSSLDADAYGQIDVYNGDYGTDLTATVKFQYGMGAHNVRAFRWNQDMTRLCNKLQYFLGPKVDANHWRANVVGTDAPDATCGTDFTAIEARAFASRCQFGTRFEFRNYDDQGDEFTLGYCLFKRLWMIEAFLRAQPQTLIHVTPTRDTAIGTFDIGDLVTVESTAEAYGGFSGAQRIYEYTITWDEDSVLALEELQVSSDAEGFSA